MGTLRVRPPSNRGPGVPKRGQAKGRTGPQEIRSWLFKYRFQLWPYWVMFVVLVLALIVVDPVILAAIYVLVACGLWFAGQYIRLTKDKHRAYAAGIALVAGAWSVWFVIAAAVWRPALLLPAITTVVAWPYFKYRTGHQTIPVEVSPTLSVTEKREAQRRANSILANWPVITRQGRIQFAELDGLLFTGVYMDVNVTLRGGQTASSIAYKGTRTSLISAFDAPEDSLRIYSREPRKQGKSGRAREVTLRFILHDINAGSLGAPPADTDTLGRFETGDPVEYTDGFHTVIAGQTGHGKSVLMNLAIRRKVRRGWAVIGVDLKPGALELGPWEPVLAYLVSGPDKLKAILVGLISEMDWRGSVMKRRGTRMWEPTPDHPNICLAVDEVQEIKQVPGALELLTRLSQLGRAYGFELLLATQYPKDSNLPADILAQITQRLCLHLENAVQDRVVFGENATNDGWSPSKIKDKGVFLIKNAIHKDPTRAKGWFMEVDEVKAEIPTMTRTTINRPWLPGSSEALNLTEGSVDMDPAGSDYADIVEAVVVSESPADTVLEAIRSGAGTLDAIAAVTNIPRASVNTILLRLMESGRITKDGKRATTLRPWRVVE